MTQSPRLRRLTGILALIAVGTLVSLRPAAAQPVAIPFAETAVLPMAATTLDISIPSVPPKEYPYVGHRSPITYEQALRSWAAQRFSLTGGSVNTLRVTMRKAEITEKLLPVATGIKGWFKKEQNAEYTGNLEVEVTILDPNGKLVATADARSWATETVREDATQADREAAWVSIVKKTFDNLDREIVPRIYEVMTAYLR